MFGFIQHVIRDAALHRGHHMQPPVNPARFESMRFLGFTYAGIRLQV